VPQLTTPPQPSPIGPQLACSSAHVRGLQLPVPPSVPPPNGPHVFGTPAPPQVRVELQVPQLRSPPQPSATGPQFAPTDAQVLGVQLSLPPHTLGVPPPPQYWGAVQPPQ
jgi:hypothetical protein